MSTPSCSLKDIFCRFRLSPSSSNSYHQLRFSPLLSETDELIQASLVWKKRKSLVPVVLSRGRQVFMVDPHMLEHWLFQDLLQKAVRKPWRHGHDEEDEAEYWMHDGVMCGEHKHGRHGPICIDCDAILFEFFLWLVKNDDPSLRDLNLGDLMEFYGAEA